MSAALSTIILNIPWMNVIASAPKVFDSAMDLFNRIAKKKSLNKVPSDSDSHNDFPQDKIIDSLQSRTIELEAAVADLNDKILAASEVIKVIAEQNTQLIKRAETNRLHIIRLSLAVAAVTIVAIISLLHK